MFYDYLILRFHENISNISKYLSQFLYLVFVPFVDIITFVDKNICDIITLKEFQYCSTTLIFHSCLRLWKGFLFRKNALYTNGFHFLKHQYLVLLREVFHLIFQFSISHRLYYSIFHRIIKTPLDYHHGTPLDKHCYCVKSVQIRSYFWSVFSCIWTEYGNLLRKFSPNTRKCGPEITTYLDTFHAVCAYTSWIFKIASCVENALKSDTY